MVNTQEAGKTITTQTFLTPPPCPPEVNECGGGLGVWTLSPLPLLFSWMLLNSLSQVFPSLILVLGYKVDISFILVTFIYSVSLYLSFLSLRLRSKYFMQCSDFSSQHLSPSWCQIKTVTSVFQNLTPHTCEQKLCKESWKIPNHLVSVFFSCSND